ncbi:MAG: ABC transporter permease [Beijerinckiaceae bacterium]
MRQIETIFWLGTKELRSFFRDFVLLGLVIYAFTVAVISQAQSNTQELRNASIAYVDYDQSVLSHRLIGAFLPPYFNKPQPISEHDIDSVMDRARYTFAIVIPPHFERDVVALKGPAIQVNIDATAMVHAGLGSGYIQEIVTTEVANFLSRNEGNLLSRGQDIPVSPVTLATRIAFNPNVMSSWFMSIMGLINNVTMLAIILAGAAVAREREHGTMDHLLVMPISPFEIAMAKIWANSLVVAVVVGLSLTLVVHGLLRVPIVGSVPLFMAGVALYLFFATSIGIFLATIARTMPQLGLLYILVSVPLMLLSGSNTPLESMPWLLQMVMSASPSTYFVSFAQSILYRGAGFDVVWREYLAVGGIGALFLLLALLRFRTIAAQTN